MKRVAFLLAFLCFFQVRSEQVFQEWSVIDHTKNFDYKWDPIKRGVLHLKNGKTISGAFLVDMNKNSIMLLGDETKAYSSNHISHLDYAEKNPFQGGRLFTIINLEIPGEQKNILYEAIVLKGKIKLLRRITSYDLNYKRRVITYVKNCCNHNTLWLIDDSKVFKMQNIKQRTKQLKKIYKDNKAYRQYVSSNGPLRVYNSDYHVMTLVRFINIYGY